MDPWQYARRNSDTPKTIKNPARKPLKQIHQNKLARHVDYIQAALTRRMLVQPYVEPMWCSYIPDTGFATPQNHAHARRLYTRQDGLRSSPSKLNNWCCARLPIVRERHLPLLFVASTADEPTRDRHSHTQWSWLVSSPGLNLALGTGVRIAAPTSPAKLWCRSRRCAGLQVYAPKT